MNKFKHVIKSLLPNKKTVASSEIKPMGVIQVGQRLPFNEMAGKQLPTISHIITKEFQLQLD